MLCRGHESTHVVEARFFTRRARCARFVSARGLPTRCGEEADDSRRDKRRVLT